MSVHKLDRTNLRRHAQRVDSYRSLVSKRNIGLNYDTDRLKKLKTDETRPKHDALENSDTEKETECRFDQSEPEVTSVMTRSASRKYASVGAIHNKVDSKELKVLKKWPAAISYPIPGPPLDEQSHLKEVVAKSLNEVMSFCKNVMDSKNEELFRSKDDIDLWDLDGDSTELIGLTPYITQETMKVNGNDETQITLHIDDKFLSSECINVISLNDEEQNETLIFQEGNECETITLHSDTYIFENKTVPSINSTYFIENNSSRNTSPIDPVVGIRNDHTYALKPSKNTPVSDCKPKSLNEDEKSDFQIEKALNDLLLNTAILKCLVCGETPQEMAYFLETAKSFYS